ncbi:MAG: HlyD family type I secretion periplasmic adaptor subunit [Desulfobulbaceae bacterium]|nr:HlyD family type I secretion periplasmic adaptor subunit [Desulfobulbaceae bacterium]
METEQKQTSEGSEKNLPAPSSAEKEGSLDAIVKEPVIEAHQDINLSSDPKPVIMAGILVIALFFGGLGIWAAFFPFSGAIIAPGITKVSTELQTIQHLEGGIVDKIYVRDGDHVQKGDTLISLKNSQIDSSVSLLQGQLVAKLAEKARLEAEKSGASEIVWPPELLESAENITAQKAMADQMDIFLTSKQAVQGKTNLYKSQIEQLQKEIVGLQEDLQTKEEILANLDEEYKAKEELYQERYIDKVQILEIQRRISELKGTSARFRQTIAGNHNKLEELKLQITDLHNVYKENAATNFGQTNDNIFSIREQLTPLLDAQSRMNITTPVSGVVINLNVHSEEGGVIQPRAPILDIVPENAELILAAKIGLNEITKVHVGQDVLVELSAFNRRKVPLIPGKVVYVSADQTTENTPMGLQSFYEVSVTIAKEELKKHDAYLSPGMPTVCFITTEKRTILQYLLEPILENLDRSLKES